MNIIAHGLLSLKNLFTVAVKIPNSFETYTLDQISEFTNIGPMDFVYTHDNKEMCVSVKPSTINHLTKLKGADSRWMCEYSLMMEVHYFRELDHNGDITVKNIC